MTSARAPFHYTGVLAAALTFIMPNAHAQEPLAPFNINGTYVFAWNGLPFGEMAVKTEENGEIFSAESRIRSAGLAGIFNPHESNSKTSGSVKQWMTHWYETFYTTRGKPKHVELIYDKNGAIKEKVIEPAEPAGKRPIIPEAKIKSAVNPLSYLFKVRDELHDALTQEKAAFDVPLFDGRRLTATRFTIERKATMESGDKSINVVETTITRTPAGGYTEKEIKKADNLPVTAYFSDDEKLTPLLIRIKLSVGSITATLTRTCKGEALCPFTEVHGSDHASNIPMPERP